MADEFESWSAAELASGTASIPRGRAELERLVEWSRNFLAKPNPALGRPGPVCPWVEAALKEDLFRVALAPEGPVTEELIDRAIEGHLERYLARAPTTGRQAQLKVVLIAFPFSDPQATDAALQSVWDRHRQRFTSRNLLIGHFGPTMQRGGMWNPAFKPFGAPMPLLALRHIVEADLGFVLSGSGAQGALFHEYKRMFAATLGDFGVAYLEKNRERLSAKQMSVLLQLLDGTARGLDGVTAARDVVTGLPTRAHLLESIAGRFTAGGRPSLLLLSPDLSRLHGDDTAQRLTHFELGRLLQRTIRSDSTVGRLDPSTYAVVAMDVTDDSAAPFEARVRRAIEENVFTAGRFKAALALEQGRSDDTAEALLRRAEDRLSASL